MQIDDRTELVDISYSVQECDATKADLKTIAGSKKSHTL